MNLCAVEISENRHITNGRKRSVLDQGTIIQFKSTGKTPLKGQNLLSE